jgi:hypothetical protein
MGEDEERLKKHPVYAELRDRLIFAGMDEMDEALHPWTTYGGWLNY